MRVHAFCIIVDRRNQFKVRDRVGAVEWGFWQGTREQHPLGKSPFVRRKPTSCVTRSRSLRLNVIALFWTILSVTSHLEMASRRQGSLRNLGSVCVDPCVRQFRQRFVDPGSDGGSCLQMSVNNVPDQLPISRQWKSAVTRNSSVPNCNLKFRTRSSREAR